MSTAILSGGWKQSRTQGSGRSLRGGLSAQLPGDTDTSRGGRKSRSKGLASDLSRSKVTYHRFPPAAGLEADPGNVRHHQQPRPADASWEPLSMKLIKELKQACALYGATAPYTLTLLDALAARWMIPHDWKTVTKACLSGGHIYSRELNMRTSPESRLVLTADMARGTLYKKCWRELMNLIQLEIRWV